MTHLYFLQISFYGVCGSGLSRGIINMVWWMCLKATAFIRWLTQHTMIHVARAYAALDVIFTYLKVNITNIYINKYMPMLLKINLVDRCFWIQNARLFIRERDVYFQSIGLWLNFIRVHFLLTLIDIFTNAAHYIGFYFIVYKCRQASWERWDIFAWDNAICAEVLAEGYISVARLRIYFMHEPRASWLHLHRILSLLHSEECTTPGNSRVYNTGSQSSKGTKAAKLD